MPKNEATKVRQLRHQLQFAQTYAQQYEAANKLGELKAKTAVRDLTQVALLPTNPHLSVLATEALGSIGTPAATRSIIRLLNHHHDHVKEAAILALDRLYAKTARPRLKRMLSELQQQMQSGPFAPNYSTARVSQTNRIINALGNIAEPADVPFLLEMSQMPTQYGTLWHQVSDALGRMRERLHQMPVPRPRDALAFATYHVHPLEEPAVFQAIVRSCRIHPLDKFTPEQLRFHIQTIRSQASRVKRHR